MLRYLGPALALSISLLATAGCQEAATCSGSEQCANGFSCNLETKKCEAEGTEPDATTLAACPVETHFCASPAPEGWSGPVIGTAGAIEDTLPACPPEFAAEDLHVFSDLVAEGSCSCECPGVTSGAVCSNASISAREGTGTFDCNASCFGNCSVAVPTTGSCQVFPTQGQALIDAPAMRVALGTIVNTGFCSAAIATDDLSAGFADQARYCSATAVEASCPEAGTCLPNASDLSFDSLCIHQEGDLECPAEYPEKRLRFADVSDARSCTSCTCSGPAIGDTCGGSITISEAGTSNNCSATPITSNGCYEKRPDRGVTAKYIPPANFDCAQSGGGEITGEATGTEPRTFCCLTAE